ncbi:protein RD3-like [Denticeps clupeoides]|uniref:RD3 protein n=1 Tax=Denticeps clupeoides TaxID=299321 RepID=A0A8C4FNT6_9TELE|nr:protein RD3-like [Denticeps clupeoides]XP_028822339.1 protein RD3-like [Denticeps clupeoides]
MFPWSAVFSLEPKVPGQRTSEELVTNTLMLELGAMVKRTERIRLERATEVRRRRGSADYSWLAGPPAKMSYELTPGDVLELQDLCAKIPPAMCGPAIVRFRKMVTEFEPEVHEVPRLFRTVLRNCLDELEGEDEIRSRANRWDKQRSQSLSFVTFRSRFRSAKAGGRGLGGSRSNLPEEAWLDEEEDEPEKVAEMRGSKRGRSRSMPEITPIEQRVQS